MLSPKIIASLFLLVIPAHAAVLQVRASFWSNKCARTMDELPSTCEIPQPIAEVQTQKLEWTEAAAAGSVTVQSLDFKANNLAAGKLTLFHVFPKPEQKQPKYFQMRFEFVSPNRGLCIESVKQRVPAEISPMMCGVWVEAEKKMVGVTLEFFSESETQPNSSLD